MEYQRKFARLKPLTKLSTYLDSRKTEGTEANFQLITFRISIEFSLPSKSSMYDNPSEPIAFAFPGKSCANSPSKFMFDFSFVLINGKASTKRVNILDSRL